jgi:hypothetical protein
MLGQRCGRVALFGILSASLCALALGCGGEKTYRVSGKVTFKGQPLPAGRIYFTPDQKKGNKGATGYADIKDGAYDTSATGGRGVIAGATTVKIEGYDPNQKEKSDVSGETSAKALFLPYQTNYDVPSQDSTKDFEVPATADPKAKGPGGALEP